MSEPSRLDRKVRLVWMAGALVPFAVLTMVSLGLFVSDVPVAPWATAGVALVVGGLALVLPSARWRSWSYVLTDTELIVRFGVVVSVERWLPRTRVQHVDIVGGPVERWLGLRQLVIYTAGTREADVSIPGLPTGTAEMLRNELLSWSRPPAAATPFGNAQWEGVVTNDPAGSIAPSEVTSPEATTPRSP